MNTGKTLFAQLMDYLPWSTLSRIVARYDGDRELAFADDPALGIDNTRLVLFRPPINAGKPAQSFFLRHRVSSLL
jgi:hypothetical protein